MWLTKFEVEMCENAFEELNSEDEAAVFAGILVKLTDLPGDRASLRRWEEEVLYCFLTEAMRKKASLAETLEYIQLFLDHGLNLNEARDGDDYKLSGSNKAGFKKLFKDAKWEKFAGDILRSCVLTSEGALEALS